MTGQPRRLSRRRFTGQLAGISTAGLLSSRLTASETKPDLTVEWTRRIYSTAGEPKQYNSFTNMAKWKGRYYVVFRQAVHHGVSDSAIMLLESDDLKTWSVRELINTEHDDRDPKILASNDRLFVYSDTLLPDNQDEMMLTWTDDGSSWSRPEKIYQTGWQLWKPKWHDGAFYVAADCVRCGHRSELLRSADGIHWESVSLISSRNLPTETAITFLPDNRLLAVIRQNIEGHPPGFAIADPPYTNWALSSGQGHFSGPAVDVIGETVVVASRTVLEDWGLPMEPGLEHQRTALYTFDLANMSLQLQTMLPTETGGDSSYPGIQPIGNDRALVSWYDGSTTWHHPSVSNIWLAQVRLSHT